MPTIPRILSTLTLLLTGWGLMGGHIVSAQPFALEGLIEAEGPVYEVPVKGMIDKGLARYIDRAIAEAELAEAAVLIFHIDTFGGLVDAADHIRKSILDAPVPTIAFIDKNAASAGALISYAADRIVMVPGASIGAATVVEGTSGEAAPDKYQSYMRGLMRATAEANGRNPQIAEAMVDESLVVPGVSEAGQVLTLSAEEALRHGVADQILDSVADLRSELGLTQHELVAHHETRLESILRFFGSPIIQSILMMMMLGGLYFELQSPGVGFAGLMSAIGAILFFAPNYIIGLVESWEIAVFVVGILLLIIEIFVVPGFGIPGSLGLLCIIGALVTSLIGNVGLQFPSLSQVTGALFTTAATLILLVILAFSLGRYLPRSGRFGKLILSPELSSSEGYTSADTEENLLGMVGQAITILRPSGAAEIDGRRIDVVSQGDFIPAGTPIRVVQVQGNRVEVRPVDALPASTA